MFAACNEPGTLHVDLKGIMVRSANGFQYAMFLVEEYSRFVFVEFLKSKDAREQAAAVARAISRFNVLANAGTDADGHPLPKPTVKVIRSDHEGALESKLFESFRSEFGIAGGGPNMSPPHDHLTTILILSPSDASGLSLRMLVPLVAIPTHRRLCGRGSSRMPLTSTTPRFHPQPTLAPLQLIHSSHLTNASLCLSLRLWI